MEFGGKLRGCGVEVHMIETIKLGVSDDRKGPRRALLHSKEKRASSIPVLYTSVQKGIRRRLMIRGGLWSAAP